MPVFTIISEREAKHNNSVVLVTLRFKNVH